MKIYKLEYGNFLKNVTNEGKNALAFIHNHEIWMSVFIYFSYTSEQETYTGILQKKRKKKSSSFIQGIY